MNQKKTAMHNTKRDLTRLLLLMNKQNMRYFPPVDAMLKTLDLLLSKEELRLLLRLGTDEYTYEDAAAMSGMDKGTFDSLFMPLVRKGFIGFEYTENGEIYSLLPVIVGWFEIHVSYLKDRPELKEFSRRWMDFLNTFRRYNYLPVRKAINLSFKMSRVSNQTVGFVHETKDDKGKSIININHTFNAPDSKIYPTESVIDLIRDYGTKSVIGQFTCMCRQVTLNTGQPCRFNFPDDGGCMGFGERMRPIINNGYARQISKEEAFDRIQKVRDRGAIHSIFHEKDDTGLPQVGLCNCCWDCCGILRSYNMGALPLRYSCYYMARVSEGSKCTGCKKCEKFCPTAAISIVEKKAVIDSKKCIGCGQCVHQCSFSALELIKNKRTAILPMLKKSEARITV